MNGEPPDRRIGVSFSGQVVLVTGAARGQGRSHALRFAQGGAAIVAVDLCAQIPSVVGYPMATRADLDETVRLVRKLGAPVWATVADVRDADGMRAVARSAVAEFGGIDVVIANAGISSYGRATELGEQAWRDVVDTNLTGVMNTIDAALASMRSRGRASVVTTSSLAGMRGAPLHDPLRGEQARRRGTNPPAGGTPCPLGNTRQLCPAGCRRRTPRTALWQPAQLSCRPHLSPVLRTCSADRAHRPGRCQRCRVLARILPLSLERRMSHR